MTLSTAYSAQGTLFQLAGTPASALTITGITKAVQAVVSATHALAIGDVVDFGVVTNMPEIAGLIGVVTAITGTSAFTVNIDSSAFAAAGTTGAATPYPAATWKTVGNCKTYNGFDGTKGEIDISHLGGTAKEYLPALEDFGQLTAECDIGFADPGQLAARANKTSNVLALFRIVLSAGGVKQRVWRGFVKKFTETAGVDGVYKGSIDVRISGAVNFGT